MSQHLVMNDDFGVTEQFECSDVARAVLEHQLLPGG